MPVAGGKLFGSSIESSAQRNYSAPLRMTQFIANEKFVAPANGHSSGLAGGPPRLQLPPVAPAPGPTLSGRRRPAIFVQAFQPFCGRIR
jgi:hypothetical protein